MKKILDINLKTCNICDVLICRLGLLAVVQFTKV